jgi:peptide deformylase
MAILPLYATPHPILRKKSLAVELVDDSIRTIVSDMIATMYHDNGIGLAAPQVGISKRILVMDLDDNDDGNHPKGFFPLCVINPEIIAKSKETATQKEGCLSVPEQYIEVTRPAEITVKFLDKNGKEQILECKGLMARCMQHEMDHLDGKLTIDYLSPLKRDTVLRKIAKLKRDKM